MRSWKCKRLLAHSRCRALTVRFESLVLAAQLQRMEETDWQYKTKPQAYAQLAMVNNQSNWPRCVRTLSSFVVRSSFAAAKCSVAALQSTTCCALHFVVALRTNVSTPVQLCARCARRFRPDGENGLRGLELSQRAAVLQGKLLIAERAYEFTAGFAILTLSVFWLQKSEGVKTPIPRSAYRNHEGPLSVTYIRDPAPHVTAFLAAAQ